MSKKCKEITFENLVSRISRANSELIFTRDYAGAVRLLYEITRDICKPRSSSSVTVRVRAKSLFGYYNVKLLVTLDVEKSSINNMYIIVFKSISKL
jgi:hypothetical protein